MKWLGGEIDELPHGDYTETRLDANGNPVIYKKTGYQSPSLQQLVEHEFGGKLFAALAKQEPPSDSHKKGRLTERDHFRMWCFSSLVHMLDRKAVTNQRGNGCWAVYRDPHIHHRQHPRGDA